MEVLGDGGEIGEVQGCHPGRVGGDGKGAGAATSPSTGFTGGGLSNPSAISPSTGFTGGGLNGPVAIAIDGFGNIWAANGAGNSVSEFSSAGTALSPATGFAHGQFNGPTGIVIDLAGSVWVSNATDNSVTEIIGLATPTVTPLSLAVANYSVGTRP